MTKLKSVDPKIIKVPEERVTARMDAEKTEQFESSVKSLGIEEPINCYEVDGELWLSDGLHRLVAAIQNGIPKVDVLVKPGTERDVLFHNLRSGHLRGKHPVSEMRRQIERAYQEYKIGIEDIVKETGLSQAYVEKLLVISQLTPMCLEALDEERIGVGHAFELTKSRSLDQQEIFLQMAIANHWTVAALKEFMASTREIEDQRAAGVAATPPASEPAAPATVACRFCGEEYPPQQLASLIMCHSCQGIMFEAVAAGRQAAREADQDNLADIKKSTG
jgi:ParB-like chromosome segregation protein Spo0J